MAVVRLLNENQGLSQLHSDGSWLMCGVALICVGETGKMLRPKFKAELFCIFQTCSFLTMS